jgi:dipeptidyl aminopeptidase/acylaminoacyl peptidase
MRRLLPVLFLLFACKSGEPPAEKKGPAQPTPPVVEPALQSAPAKAPQAPVPLAEYFKVRRVGGASFSHDESLIAYLSDEGGRMDVWVQPVAGGPARQVTRVQGFVHSFAFSPAQDQLVFEADLGGNELPTIYLTNSKGEGTVDLMSGDPKGSRTSFIRWAEDGKTFLYLSSRRDPKYLDLYEFDLAKRKSMLLWKSSGRLSFALASRDHQRFILQETVSDVDSNLFLVGRDGKDPVLLTPHQGEILYSPMTFSQDGWTLYYTSDEGGEFQALYAMDLRTRKKELKLKESWDVEQAGFSRTWRYFFTVTNVDGTPRPVLTEAKTQAPVPIPAPGVPGVLVPTVFSKSDRYYAARLSSDVSPPTLYIVDVQKGEARRLVDPLPESLRGRSMVTGRLVRIPSFDQREVPAFLYEPKGSGPFPAVIEIHGGPTAQARRSFNRLGQYAFTKGYVYLVPNVRGSTGYGKTYTKLDNLDLGGGPLRDVVSCKRWLVTNAKVDPNRVVVLGGSYGGYMALAAATFTPTEFGALVDYVGPSDLKSLVQSFPPYWAAMATFIYKKFGNPDDPAHARYQYERSPIHFVDRIERPLLIVQMENDARVRKDQSDRIVAQLKARKVPVHYLVIPGEGHGFSKNENLLKAYEVTDRFLDRYIFGDQTVTGLP